ncbi:trypsin-like peptidase domain-containing protein [Kitasatospora cineracea]|uniref:S1 family peptidase n=1 Tax=Kitasatospora cineracea TaxID=88074 RepID=UPI0033F73936
MVAPGLVLTAFHVVEPEHEDAEFGLCTVGLIGTDDRAVAEVAWHREDAALLRFRPRDLPREYAPVRWGELACAGPAVPARCFAVGLPAAAVREVTDGGEVWKWRAPEVAEGHINAVDTGGLFYSLQVDSAAPTAEPGAGSSPWEGMSGAGVFHEDLLLGTVQQAVPGRGNARLEVIPASWLLDDRGFCDIVERACGTRPQLEPADLDGLFESAPQPAAAASYLLAARSEVVEFTGLDSELQLLLDWCHRPNAVDVAVVQGPGGAGKTRLAVELSRRLSERRPEAERSGDTANLPWSTGFLDASTTQAHPYNVLRHLIRPVLIVVDYAEYRPDQVKALLQTLAQHRAPGHRVRVLLVARSTRHWWPQLRAQYAAMVAGVEVTLSPESFLRQSDPQEVREHARLAFTRRITALRRSGLPDDWDPEEYLDRPGTSEAHMATEPHRGTATVLSLHIDTLAEVLLDNPLADTLDPYDVLLSHEERYWERAAAKEPQHPLDPYYLKTLIAVQRMAGAANRGEALEVIRTAWATHYADATVMPVLHPDALHSQRRILSRLYPPVGGAYWSGVGPDALTARLINDIEAEFGRSPGHDIEETFLARTLSSPALSPAQRRHSLTIVGRCLSSHPTLAEAAAYAATASPELLLADAQHLLRELPEREHDVWQAALTRAREQHKAAAPAADMPPISGQEDVRSPATAQPPDGPEPSTGQPPPPSDDTVLLFLPRPSRAPAARDTDPEVPRKAPVVTPQMSRPPLRQPMPSAPSSPSAESPRSVPVPRRTVPIAIRDYFGLDAHGMRRVLAAVLILTVLGAGTFLLTG